MDNLRESIRTFLKLPPLRTPTDIHLVDETEEAGFRRSLIRYSVRDGEQIEAFLFEPTIAEARGAVLALHQHNSQWDIGKSEVAGLAGDPLQAFGPALAHRGITVLAPDSIGFESRMKRAGWGATLAPALSKSHSTEEGWLQYYNHVAHRLVRGGLLMRDILADCEIALSILHGRTKNSHLGVVGHSFGGTVALFLAALDTRVAFACASGAACSFRHKLAAGTALEGSLIIPGFHERFDLDDLLRCVAPRRILVVSAESDPYSADANDLVKTALPAFEMLQCGDRLEHLRVPGPHALDQGRFDAILNWTVANATGS